MDRPGFRANPGFFLSRTSMTLIHLVWNTKIVYTDRMRILGIETSCDDTAVGLVTLHRGRLTVDGHVTAGQVLIHRKYGGVVPEVAAREHALTIIPTIQELLRRTKRRWQDIDAIAVTAGPGLSTALNVGVECARTLAYGLRKPLVRVNHIEGHIASAWAASNATAIRWPAVALIVSGGHTELILVRRFGVYSLLGRTIDDAVGEAFDKTAKILGLPYPGGPQISRLAERGDHRVYRFPRSLLGKNSLDFSYAGLKTAVLYETLKSRRLTARRKADVAAGFQAAALEPLIIKSRLAIQRTRARSFIVAGGVAANATLRESLRLMIGREFPRVSLITAPLPLCMDNGVMIAIAGAFRAQHKKFMPWPQVTADPNWELVEPRVRR